jgi:hypothetical protein
MAGKCMEGNKTLLIHKRGPFLFSTDSTLDCRNASVCQMASIKTEGHHVPKKNRNVHPKTVPFKYKKKLTLAAAALSSTLEQGP